MRTLPGENSPLKSPERASGIRYKNFSCLSERRERVLKFPYKAQRTRETAFHRGALSLVRFFERTKK